MGRCSVNLDLGSTLRLTLLMNFRNLTNENLFSKQEGKIQLLEIEQEIEAQIQWAKELGSNNCLFLPSIIKKNATIVLCFFFFTGGNMLHYVFFISCFTVNILQATCCNYSYFLHL